MRNQYIKSKEVSRASLSYTQRKILPEINWNARLNVIMGLRGVGKTTYLLQENQKRLAQGKESLYLSLDDFYFLSNDLWSIIEDFHSKGGEFLFIDEVHYYKNWDVFIKNAYDRYPFLKITVTGSSAIKLYRSKADLSRRGHFYYMPGFSFREYLYYKEKDQDLINSYNIDELIKNREEIVNMIGIKKGIRKKFHDYLETGYFPFSLQENIDIKLQLKQLLENTVQLDLSIIKEFRTHESRQILAFLKYIAASSPFKLNISRISNLLSINRNKLLEYLDYLEIADLIYRINYPGSKKGSMSKPDKIYLNNPNLYYSINKDDHYKGSVREAFVLNQLLQNTASVNLHKDADFEVNGKYFFEVGGQGKNKKQIARLENSFILADNLESTYAQYLPLWIVGFLY